MKLSVLLTTFTPTHNVHSAYGWIKKGVRKEISADTGRARLNLSGSIDITTHNVVVQEDETLNAESTIRFFQKLENAYPSKRKIHVFCDNAPYYRNKAVKQSNVTNSWERTLERLWKWMKERVIYNTYYEHFEDFEEAICGFFAVLSAVTAESFLGQTLRSRVRDKFRPV